MNPFHSNALITIESYIYESEPSLPENIYQIFTIDAFDPGFIGSGIYSAEERTRDIEILFGVQKLRMDDNFTYTIDTTLIDDVDEVNIPPMLTQPFIENAIEHGFRKDNSWTY